MLNRQSLQPLLFLGLGAGALFAALCLPRLLIYGVGTSVVALTVFSAVAALALAAGSTFMQRDHEPTGSGAPILPMQTGVALVLLSYGCDALGFVMHTVNLPDMLLRAYGYSEGQVGVAWAFFGMGACLGPTVVMAVRRRVSGSVALWGAMAAKAVGVALVLVAQTPVVAALSLFIVGLLTPGMVILTSGALSARTTHDRFLGIWAAATALFALCQMVAGLLIAAMSGQGYGVALGLSVAILAVGAMLAFAATFFQPEAS